jgi:hypothetical protein
MATTESSPSGHTITTTDPASIAGDPFAWAGRRLEEPRRGLSERRTEAELVEAVYEEEGRRGYPMSYGERVAFARGFFAPEYEACHFCYDGWVFLGYEGVNEDGALVEVGTERVPCRRCRPEAR